MPRYRKKPVEVEAIQWDGRNSTSVDQFCGTFLSATLRREPVFVPVCPTGPELWVAANKAWVSIEPGEWIIRDRHGCYPCKPDVFTDTYEPA